MTNPEGVQLLITMGAALGERKPHPRSLSRGEEGLQDRLGDKVRDNIED